MSNYTKSTNFATKDNLTPGDPLKVVRGTEIDTEFNNIATAVATKTDNSAAAITGGSITGITDLAIADGGTGASTATAALNNLLPSQTGNSNKYLQTDGTNATWDAVTLSTADITGTLPVANGGTGITSFGTGIATFLGTPSSANLASAVTDETGSGALVFANTPTLVSPILGTPTSGNFSSGSFTWPTFNQNTTGTAAGLSATLAIASGGTGQTTANAAFNALAPSQTSASGKYLKSDGTNTSWDALDISTADITGTLPVANGGTGVTSSTGTGNVVLSNSPTLVTPILGTPQSGNFSTGTFTWPTFNQNTTGTAAGLSATLATTSGGTGLTSFTSGGVVYASSSSALATGSNLTYNGNILVNQPTTGTGFSLSQYVNTGGTAWFGLDNSTGGISSPYALNIYHSGAYPIVFSTSGSEQMRLTSTGLGIGTSSPARKLDAQSTTADYQLRLGYNSSFYYDIGRVNSNGYLGFYGSQTGATGFTFGGVDGTRMTLDSAGNLGLGVTPSAWNSNWRAFQFGTGGSLSNAISQASLVELGGNFYQDSGGTERYIASSTANKYRQYAGAHSWYTAASGTAGDAISFTQAMTLDASSNLSIGGTSNPSEARLYLESASTTGTLLNLVNTSSGGYSWNIVSVGSAASLAPVGSLAFRDSNNGATRMVIDTSGNLLVGRTTTANTTVGSGLYADGIIASCQSASTNANTAYDLYSTGASAYRFYVGMGGTIYATSTTITAISDQRLKENIRDLDEGLATVMALKPRKFDWKEGKGQNIKNARGFIAQEFETVLPDMIEEWRDPAPEGEEPYKAINANLIPTLVKAIQEQQTIIESLKARLDAANL